MNSFLKAFQHHCQGKPKPLISGCQVSAPDAPRGSVPSRQRRGHHLQRKICISTLASMCELWVECIYIYVCIYMYIDAIVSYLCLSSYMHDSYMYM